MVYEHKRWPFEECPSLQTTHSIYEMACFIEQHPFGLRYLFQAEDFGGNRLCFTVTFPPSYFAGEKADVYTLGKVALKHVQEALEQELDAVRASQSQLYGHGIVCSQKTPQKR